MAVESDVLVVGAGPVGMTLAVLLAARGVSVEIVERNPGSSNEPKAISLDDEALRVYQSAGIVDEVLSVIVPGTGTRYYDSEGATLVHARSAIALHHGYPFKNPFAQPDLERVLLQSLRRFPKIGTRFGTELVGLEDEGKGIRAHLAGRHPGEVRARFAVGADGGRSTVRSLRGIGMTGRGHDEVWLVVDTINDSRTERYAMHHGDPARPHVVVPGLDGRCRYELRLFAGEGEVGEQPDFELIRSLIAPYRTLEPEDVERAVAYRFHGLVADEWRSGPVFLAGDSAHMMPPFAGQGLNSGIRDAANLAWKLAQVIDGTLGDAALDSYQLERAPHATAVVRSSERLGRVVMTTRPRIAAHRDRVVRAALATDSGRAYFEQMKYRPVARFEQGLVVQPDRDLLVGRMIGQPRVFDVVDHRLALLDDVLGTGWAVLGVHVARSDWDAARAVTAPLMPRLVSIPLDDTMEPTDDGVFTVIDLDGRLPAEFESARGRFVLLRPDRFIAAIWNPGEGEPVRAAIGRWRR